VAGDAGEEEAEIDAGGNRFAVGDADGGEADVVGFVEDADGVAAVEGDVEFAVGGQRARGG